MRLKLYLFPLIAGTIFLFSCSRNSVSLSFTNAKGEVPVLGNLVFRFDHSLVKDSMLNAWDSTDYFQFEPSIKGRFRWQAPDELVFSPAEPLAPATVYKAKAKNSLLKYSKYNSVKGGDLSFNTPGLTLDNAQVNWVGESNTGAMPQLELVFNYAVNPDDLRDRIKLEIDGKPAELSIITATASERISVKLPAVKLEDRAIETKLIIDKGLKPVKGNKATDEKITDAITISSPYVLSIHSVEGEHDGVDGVVKVSTSQQVSGDIRSYIRIEPALEFTVEPDENGFSIRSNKFDVEKAYSITIGQGLRGKLGGMMKEEYQGGFGFGELESNIRFTNSKAMYLSKKGAKNIEVQITNTPKIRIIISRIYENNLLMAHKYGYSPVDKEGGPGWNYGEVYGEEYSSDEYGGGEGVLGDVIYEKEMEVRNLPRSGPGRLLNMAQFEGLLPDFKGIYHVVVRSAADYWVKDSRFISVSDLGMITKQGDDKIYVFTNSLKTADPVEGVNISVYAVNNQLIGTGTTDKEGVAAVNYSHNEYSGFKPAMVIAKTADDFNYLPFGRSRVNTSRFDVGGKRNNPSGLDAYVYAERDVYRPGEKINFSVILRDENWSSPGDVPLKLKFLLPNGKELKTLRKSLNEEGSMEGSIELSTAAITGSYTLEVYTSSDVLLATKNFSVEEFVPDRIRVSTKLNREFLKKGESALLSINAMNFFGPPAANRNYETEIQTKQKVFSADKFPDYNFSLANQTSFFDKQVSNGTTDADGNASLNYTVPETYSNMGALQTNFYTTVFDETGRPVSRLTKVDIYTQDIFFGIRQDWSYYFPLNQPMKLQLVAVNKDGSAVNGTARVLVIKHEYRTVLTKTGTYFRYESQKQDKNLSDQQMNIGVNTAFSFIPRTPGDYEVRIFAPGASSYVSRSFYSYGSYGMSNSSFDVSREGNIDIEIDKKSFETGDNVKALFKTPFSGKMLVTLETDELLFHQYVEVSNRTASLEIPLGVKHVPNVYITATLIKPHEESDIPLTVAHGFKNISVEDKSRHLAVSLVSQKNVRSRTHQKVQVKAAPGSFVTLAAVDNGVLQISDFKSPDPYDYFYQKRALGITAFDMYPLLFEEVRARLSSTGGDGEANMDKRANPMPAKRIKVVSYWGGIKKADGNGVAEFEFDVPQFSGELRLMAVSYKGKCFGAADQTMTVADPIVISTALPRFLSPGDTVNVPVTITNTTSKASSVTATLKLEGSLKIAGINSQSVSLAAKTEGRAEFRIVADKVINAGKITVTVNGMGEKFMESTDISVRPPSTLQKYTGAGSVTGGNSQKINLSNNDLIPGSVNYSLVVSRSPVVELGSLLRSLVQYPYGCTEQTVSAAFPQLYYGDLADLMQTRNSRENKLNANSNILEAIRKIKMRQLYNGAVTLWDGEGKEDWWTSIYAAHFLLEARKAGFEVDNSLLNTMLNYINNKLKNKQTITYYYNRDQNKKIAPKEVAYSLYVLSMADRSNVPSMNYYKANANLLALDSRYLLAAAYAVAGDKRSFAAMLPTSFSGEESVAQSGGSFYSDIRDEGIALNALMEVDPGNAQVPFMIKHLSAKLKARNWLSTQEKAFAFLALGKQARMSNASSISGEVKVNGKLVGIVNAENGTLHVPLDRSGKPVVELVAKGAGRLYYSWETEGISASGSYKEEDNYIKVRRLFYDRNGRLISNNTFKQNELVIVGITLERSFNSIIENIVITDILPAGFEIENPRTKEIPGMDWIKNASSPTALDVRDDRIHFFVDAISNRQTYYYAVRAVSPGNFRLGPVNADAMYNGEYHSYNGAGIIRVIR